MKIDELSPLIRSGSGGLFLSCHVQPGASRTNIAGVYGTALKIALAAPPVDGKANKELCIFLAKKLKLPNSSVQLTAGLTSRNKTVFLPGITPEQLAEKL